MEENISLKEAIERSQGVKLCQIEWCGQLSVSLKGYCKEHQDK